jgi:tRNA-Thr(GGU) m(6)t(6)A37 methyltransferase TsaA
MSDLETTPIVFHPIGHVRHQAASVPRHWSVSDVEGELVIDERYAPAIGGLQPGERIVVLFHFHRSAPFTPALLFQRPPHRNRDLGVFSICSPRRPNPIGLSVVEVLEVFDNRIRVRGLDMFDGTPIIDLKPFVSAAADCPSTDRRD